MFRERLDKSSKITYMFQKDSIDWCKHFMVFSTLFYFFFTPISTTGLSPRQFQINLPHSGLQISLSSVCIFLTIERELVILA